MRRSHFALLMLLAGAAACGGRARGIDSDPRSVSIARPLEVYHDLGMLVGPGDFPAVARFTTLAGPADSTFVLLTMSMPNSAIRFLRDESAFYAEYRVNATLLRDTITARQIDRRETVRVASFAETNRIEESIIFQDAMTLLPGRYIVRLQVADQNSSRGFRGLDTIDVPAYPRDRRITQPLVLYGAASRDSVAERPAMIVNPRNTVPYGGGGPRIYLEQYGAAAPEPVELRVVDESGTLVWQTTAAMTDGNSTLRHATISVPDGVLPIGRLWLEAAAADGQPLREPLMVAISDEWMVANFDEVLRFLRHIAFNSELDSLRRTTGAERNAVWERFWARRDPLPATPANEFREQFFERVKHANDEFSETGRLGWETDRGEVYIILGPPDYTFQNVLNREHVVQVNVVEWLYETLPGGRLVLQFFDRSGFGRYELTEASKAAFNTMAARIKGRPGS